MCCVSILVLLVAVTAIDGSPRTRGEFDHPLPQSDQLILDPEDKRSSNGKFTSPPAQIDPEDKRTSKDEVLVDDMIIPRHMNEHEAKEGPVKRQAFIDDGYKWGDSTEDGSKVILVPYTRSGVDDDVFDRAVRVFTEKTCIRFKPRTSDQTDYVQFESGSSCSARIGKQGGVQTCDLTSSCSGKKGKVMHEMMHVLNFLHEQCRSDRDDHITVNTDNIIPSMLVNYNIVTGSDAGIAYDCDSILHYKDTAFASSSDVRTMTSSECSNFGNGDTRLSLLDYKRINTYYSCPDNPNYRYFTVVVVTSDSYWSGTDCYVYLTLHGTQKTSTKFELDLATTASNLFETGSTDTFNYMAYRDDLGTISGISIRMEPNGGGPAWKPTSFTITNPVNDDVKKFTNSNWLYASTDYGTSSFTLTTK